MIAVPNGQDRIQIAEAELRPTQWLTNQTNLPSAWYEPRISEYRRVRSALDWTTAGSANIDWYETSGALTNSTALSTNQWLPAQAYTGTAAVNVYQYYQTSGSGYINSNQWVNHQPAWQPATPEELARREAQAAEYRERNRILYLRGKRQRQNAYRRGRKLLINLLTPEQLEQYARTSTFDVADPNGRVFRLTKGRLPKLLGADGEPTHSYCIHPSGGFIDEDVLIAQKFMIETDPATFDKVANISLIRAPSLTVVREANYQRNQQGLPLLHVPDEPQLVIAA